MSIETNDRPSPHGNGTATAQGKLILLGEHAVVHGSPALVCGIDRGVSARALPATKTTLALRFPGNVTPPRITTQGNGEVSRALCALLKALDLEGPWELHAAADLPPGAGLGCSAALGVGIARAVVCGAALPQGSNVNDRVAGAAMAWERVFHGNPSGADVHAAMHGGICRFIKPSKATTIPLGSPLHLVVVHTGQPSSTRVMVERFAERIRDMTPTPSSPGPVQRITQLVTKAENALRAMDVTTLGHCMNSNHLVLHGAGMSTPKLEQACAELIHAGALGAKLTGSGGGGCAVGLASDRDHATRLTRSLSAHFPHTFPVQVLSPST